MEIIKKYIKKEHIKVSLEGETTEEIYKELFTLLEKTNEIESSEDALKSLLKRDEVIEPYRGKGILIARLPLICERKISLVIGIKKEGLKKEVFDREKINLFLIILTPKSGNEEYINLLSEISHLLNQDSIKEDILEAKSREEVIKILLEQ